MLIRQPGIQQKETVGTWGIESPSKYGVSIVQVERLLQFKNAGCRVLFIGFMICDLDVSCREWMKIDHIFEKNWINTEQSASRTKHISDFELF